MEKNITNSGDIVNSYLSTEDNLLPYIKKFLVRYLEDIIQDPENTLIKEFFEDKLNQPPLGIRWYEELKELIFSLELKIESLEKRLSCIEPILYLLKTEYEAARKPKD